MGKFCFNDGSSSYSAKDVRFRIDTKLRTVIPTFVEFAKNSSTKSFTVFVILMVLTFNKITKLKTNLNSQLQAPQSTPYTEVVTEPARIKTGSHQLRHCSLSPIS